MHHHLFIEFTTKCPVSSIFAKVSCARHTSHVTRHTSHVTRHTSHITHHTSHVTFFPNARPLLSLRVMPIAIMAGEWLRESQCLGWKLAGCGLWVEGCALRVYGQRLSCKCTVHAQAQITTVSQMTPHHVKVGKWREICDRIGTSGSCSDLKER